MRRQQLATAPAAEHERPRRTAQSALSAALPHTHIACDAGFIACNMIKHLIANGHTVRGTVRDAAKDGEHLKTLGAEVVEVKDLKDVEALAKAFAGVDGVFHMAAVHPEYGFAETAEGREGILKCAVDGTKWSRNLACGSYP